MEHIPKGSHRHRLGGGALGGIGLGKDGFYGL